MVNKHSQEHLFAAHELGMAGSLHSLRFIGLEQQKLHKVFNFFPKRFDWYPAPRVYALESSDWLLLLMCLSNSIPIFEFVIFFVLSQTFRCNLKETYRQLGYIEGIDQYLIELVICPPICKSAILSHFLFRNQQKKEEKKTCRHSSCSLANFFALPAHPSLPRTSTP